MDEEEDAEEDEEEEGTDTPTSHSTASDSSDSDSSSTFSPEESDDEVAAFDGVPNDAEQLLGMVFTLYLLLIDLRWYSAAVQVRRRAGGLSASQP